MFPWLFPLFWVLLIFLGSSIPGGSIPAPVSVASQVLHACEYAVLAYLIARAFSQTKKEPKHSFSAIIILAFSISVLYGATDELHQLYVPGRHPDSMDVFVDALGSGIGVFVWYRLKRGI
ncbi:MAG: VanZ family protein [Patescibacteria group bacterium]